VKQACHFKTPRTSLKEVGEPRRVPLDSMNEAQKGSIRYDWTPWSHEQLKVMEAQWDEWAKFYQGFLRDGQTYGINLGTHNGAIQKAFERLGYRMYGIEYTDHIEELHAYGCNGERGNFFHMPQIETDKYDFAIVDRALCSNKNTSWSITPNATKEKNKIEYFTDLIGVKTKSGPPFFDDVSRIVKTGGTIIVSFRTYVSRIWIDDIASHGNLSIKIDDRKRPYYLCVLEKGDSVTHIQNIDDFISDFVNKKDKNIIYQNPFCMKICENDNEISFLYTPNNRKIVISTSNWRVVLNKPYFETL